MKINSVEISNLGFFRKIKMEFKPQNINVIIGANGSGKTTILSILYSMFQDEEKIKYSNAMEEAHIVLNFEEGSEQFCLDKYYKDGETQIIVSSLADMKRIALLNYKKVYLYSGGFLNYDYQFTNVMMKNALDLLNRYGVDNCNILKESYDLNTHYKYISGGEQALIRILNMLSYIPKDSVLLLDEPFAMLEENAIKILLGVMRKLQIQIILTSTGHSAEYIEGENIYLATNWNDRCYGYPEFEYKDIFYDDMKTLIYDQIDEEEQREEEKIIKYILGGEVEEIESRNIEYKEVKGNNPCASIVDVTEIYINAFLNSHVAGIGVIKWGISDNGIVKGVKLSKKDRDDIDRKLSERIGQMKPYVSADVIQISYENILDGEEIVKDVFVVEVVIRPWTSDILFLTSKGDVYIKTEGGRKKLDAYDVQKELQGRNKFRI